MHVVVPGVRLLAYRDDRSPEMPPGKESQLAVLEPMKPVLPM
jgi:hypothetical protein